MTDYKLEFKAAAARDLYKLTKQDKFLGKEIIDKHLPRILADPFGAGRKKKGDLAHVRGYNFNFKGVAYRILYSVEAQVVRIIAVGKHDVAYRRAAGRD